METWILYSNAYTWSQQSELTALWFKPFVVEKLLKRKGSLQVGKSTTGSSTSRYLWSSLIKIRKGIGQWWSSQIITCFHRAREEEIFYLKIEMSIITAFFTFFFIWGRPFPVYPTQRMCMGLCNSGTTMFLLGMLDSGFQCGLCRPNRLSKRRTIWREIHLIYCKTWKCNYLICN